MYNVYMGILVEAEKVDLQIDAILQAQLERVLTSDVEPVRLQCGANIIELPRTLNEVLVRIVKSMGTNQSIYIVGDNQTVTTSVAADYLGVSRQYCVRILERGDIPCHYVGTHRRIYLKDVLSYVNHRTIERKAALDSMTRELVDAGLDDQYVDLSRQS
jgi:excisionase family DNA binding protein